jgi:predicted GIY-YIG superfamily endonuclease
MKRRRASAQSLSAADEGVEGESNVAATLPPRDSRLRAASGRESKDEKRAPPARAKRIAQSAAPPAKKARAKRTAKSADAVEAAPPAKKRRRSGRKSRRAAPELAAADFGPPSARRAAWGVYIQMNRARTMAGYVGKTNSLARRTGQHRRLTYCKHTRRFGGDIAPLFFVTGGFGCSRDAEQFEWRLKHELQPRSRFARAYSAEERLARLAAVRAIRVPPTADPPPAPALQKALTALCSMLQIGQWTNGAVSADHPWRAGLPAFRVHWFCPDPVGFGFDVARLVTAFPVEHAFGCTEETLRGL